MLPSIDLFRQILVSNLTLRIDDETFNVHSVSCVGLWVDAVTLIHPEVVIHLPEGRGHLKARVVKQNGGRALIRVSDIDTWRRFIETTVFPTTRRGAADVWQVFRDSGYLELSDTIDGGFEQLKESFEACSTAIARAPHLGCQINWPLHGRVKATLANLRLNEGSWFSYHLAVAPDNVEGLTKEILYDMYVHYLEHSLAIEGPKWQVAYIQQDAHWSARVHVDLPKKFVSEERALIIKMNVYEVPVIGKKLSITKSMIRQANESELSEVLLKIQASRGSIYCDALDLVIDKFHINELIKSWHEAGLKRARAMFVSVNEMNVVTAALLADFAESGLHLFNLQNTVRIYNVSASYDELLSLMDEARKWFRTFGLRTCCFLDEEGIAIGKLMSPAITSILSVERFPEMIEELKQIKEGT